MTTQNVDAVSEKNRQKCFCPLIISFRGTELNVERIFYVVWESFEKIGEETAGKECLGKNSTQNIMVVLC